MLEKEKLKDKIFKKHNSFYSLNTKKQNDKNYVLSKIIKIKQNEKYLKNINKDEIQILDQAIKDLTPDIKNDKNNDLQFKLTENVISEIENLEEKNILKYVIHRYRYEIFPKKQLLHKYPPCLQIEPSSICNYRCVFCFETDPTFNNKKFGHMGSMQLDMFKNIVDQAQNNVEFITIASRGEPLVSKNINEMLIYTKNKFLNLKLNTNASLLTEKLCHTILQGGVQTIVFSADAADENMYKKLRVGGDLNKVLKNVEMFQNIREKQYSSQKIISRVSGVKVSKEQNFNSMLELWGNLVDQVAFVEYNPWENTYLRKMNNIKEPCSDLWRRMFVWWDGKANPCDVDYKSNLSVGTIKNKSLEQLWHSDEYIKLRNLHQNNLRSELSPCKSCTVI